MNHVLTRPAVAQKLVPDYNRAKQRATELLNQFGFTEPPIDPVRIARELGMNVYFAKFSEEGRDISGFFDAETDSIYVNKDEYPPRQTFTVAHELGHRELHHDWANSSQYKVLLRRTLAGDANDPYEKEANVFAAQLLVPSEMLARYISIANTQELASLFMVSMPVITNRIKFDYGR